MPDILVICTANVCRSPFAHALLEEQLNRSRVVEVVSAGTRVKPGQPVCEIVQKELGHDEFAESHKSRSLESGLVAQADLILTAEMSQRASVSRLDVKARAKTFSLLEASALVQAIDAARVDEFGRRRVEPLNENLPSLVRHLNAARGLARPETALRARRLRRKSRDPMQAFSIPDGHNLGPIAHRRALASVSDSVDQLAQWLRVNLA